MDTSETAVLQAAAPEGPRLWRLTADQYQAMGEAGILCEDDRVELLDGVLYQMSPIQNWQNTRVDRRTDVLVPCLIGRATVRVQGSFRLSPTSEPQPDVLVLRRREDFYRGRAPGPDAVLLLVEISNSSLAYDRDVKLPLYARAGISEVWIVSRRDACVEVYRDPSDDHYASISFAGPEQTLAPMAFPDMTIAVSEIFS